MLCNKIIRNGKSRDTSSEHFTIIHLLLLTKASLCGNDCPITLSLCPHYTLNPFHCPPSPRVPPTDEPCRRWKRNGRIVVVVVTAVNGTPSIVSPAAVCVPEIIAAATARMKTDFNHLFQSV